MVNWEDREYVNPRKRIFKNLDTGEILNLEIQEDPDNISKESSTPLTAHNLNLMQIEILKAENPIGHIRIETTNTNPSEYLGFGTWVLWGAGRVPVGIDESQKDFETVEKIGGSNNNSAEYTPEGVVEYHTLTVEELPKHSHDLRGWGYISTEEGGSRQFVSKNERTTEYSGTTTETGKGKGHDHGFKGKKAEISISSLQPYITCYMWKRTA